ncbi:MAG: hypothetical protein J6Y45_07505 [Bacteroidales bacterium]|nr:hypothetical protein [Bacteroidales bacterium]
MKSIRKAGLVLTLHEPLDGFYKGTRFDRGGVFDSLEFNGLQMCGRWFVSYDPLSHDAVCGPAEEFSPIGYDNALPGGTFIKPGVGLLRREDSSPYDRFHLYEIADPGSWNLQQGDDYVLFEHVLDGVYNYRKRISLLSGDSFQISHLMQAAGEPLCGEVYNHNFWTFGRMQTGPSRKLDFPFTPDGHWRSAYDSVALSENGIRFSRPLSEGESVYMGDIHSKGQEGMPYRISLSEGPLRVDIQGDVPVVRTVFWANHRVACPEPYNEFRTPCRWTITYKIYEK